MASIIPGYKYDKCRPSGRSSSAIGRKIVRMMAGIKVKYLSGHERLE